MRKGSKYVTKKVFIPEENEEEKYRKVEAKKTLIRAEFEKHKKEILVNTTDISKSNEIRLRNQLEELANANERKAAQLKRIEKSEETMERTNMEATLFNETISKLDASRENEAYLSVGFYPNRTTSTMFGVRDSNFLESLGEKKAQLLETLANIELLLEQEDEAKKATQERFEELKKDQLLISKKIHELQKMNDHAGKRFTDLQRVEFLAMNRHAASASNLKGLKDDIREIKNQELAYKKQKESDKRKEIEYVNAKQSEISNLLVELDRKRQEDQQKQEELRKLELQYDEMRVKRKNTRLVTQYIEVFNALQGEKKLTLGAINQVIKEISEQPDSSRAHSPKKSASAQENRRTSPTNSRGNSPKRNTTQADDENSMSPLKLNSTVQRNFYIEKIQKFYETFSEGPEKLAESVIKRYSDECFKEESLKVAFEEMQNRKKRQETELQRLEKEFEMVKARNEYITQGQSGSKILDSNEQEAIDSGMLVINHLPTTLSQAKFDFEQKKGVDKEIDLLHSTEAFVMRCYFDSVEMITRFSKLLSSIQTRSGGNIPIDLKDVCKNTLFQVALLRKEKKANQQLELSMSHAISEGQTELHIPLTETASVSEKEQESDAKLDLGKISDVFLAMFEGYTKEATAFVNCIKNDVVLCAFITIEDIKVYLQRYQKEVFLESQIQKILSEIDDLRDVAIQNMIQKFQTTFKLYTDLTSAAYQATEQTCEKLRLKGIDVQMEDVGRRNSEPNAFVEKATEKKWQSLIDKYDYDPAREHRRENLETETTEENMTYYHRDNVDDMEAAERELWDNEDLNSKLNEIVGSGVGKGKGNKQFDNPKTLFKNRNQEEARRIQLKKEKDKKKKIAMENMTDDEFLDWQRKQIKKDGQEDSSDEKHEYDPRRKAQEDLTQRLSPTMRLDDLKRMIGNSKLLSKIQILEKQRFATDDRNNFKLSALDNYVPLEPKKVSKSPLNRTSQDYKIRITRKAQTPTDRHQRIRFTQDHSERLSETEEVDTPKDSYLKIATTKSASKFKPQGVVESATIPKHERPYTQGSKRLRTLENPRRWPIENLEDSRQKSQEKSSSAIIVKSKSQSGNKRKKLILHNIQSKIAESDESSSKVKPASGLKTDKSNKKLDTSASQKKINFSFEKNARGQGHLYDLLNRQLDPRLKMVYAPNFFTGSFQDPSLSDVTLPQQAKTFLIPDKI